MNEDELKYAITHDDDTGQTSLFIFGENGGATLEMDKNWLQGLINDLTRHVQ